MKRNTPKASHIAAHAPFPSLEINPQWHKLQFWQLPKLPNNIPQINKKPLLIILILICSLVSINAQSVRTFSSSKAMYVHEGVTSIKEKTIIIKFYHRDDKRVTVFDDFETTYYITKSFDKNWDNGRLYESFEAKDINNKTVGITFITNKAKNELFIDIVYSERESTMYIINTTE